jgi:hypothetical protein
MLNEKDKKALTTKELSEAIGCHPDTILSNAKICLPNKEIINGKSTIWSEVEITLLIEQIKKNNNNQHDLRSSSVGISTTLTPALKIKQAFELMQEGYEEELQRINSLNLELQQENGDFRLAASSRISKKEIRTRIVNIINDISKENKDYQGSWRRLYTFFKQQHPNIEFNHKNKLDDLIKKGYGDELLEILLIKF